MVKIIYLHTHSGMRWTDARFVAIVSRVNLSIREIQQLEKRVLGSGFGEF
jgi:hypothetical protein